MQAKCRDYTQLARFSRLAIRQNISPGSTSYDMHYYLALDLSQSADLNQVHGADHATQCIIKAIETSFHSLHISAQTIETHWKMQNQYQLVMRRFRSTIAAAHGLLASYVPAYVLALYEVCMICYI